MNQIRSSSEYEAEMNYSEQVVLELQRHSPLSMGIVIFRYFTFFCLKVISVTSAARLISPKMSSRMCVITATAACTCEKLSIFEFIGMISRLLRKLGRLTQKDLAGQLIVTMQTQPFLTVEVLIRPSPESACCITFLCYMDKTNAGRSLDTF